MRSIEPHDDEGRRPAVRFAGLALAAVIGAASIAAPLAASADEAAPETSTAIEAAGAAPVEDPAGEPASAPAEGTGADASEEAPIEEPAPADVPAPADAESPDAEPIAGDEPEADQAEADPAGAGRSAEAPAAAAQKLGAEPAGAGPDAAPVAVDDHFEMLQDTVLTVGEPSVQINDYDPDGDWFRVNQHTWPASGTLAWINGGPAFTYTPPAGFTGTVTFTYEVGYNGVQSNDATVTIDVLPTGSDFDAQPVAVDDTYLYTPNTPLYIADYLGLLVNDAIDGPVTSIGFPYNNVLATGEVNTIGLGGAFYADLIGSGTATFSVRYRVCTAAGCDDATLWLYPADADVEPSGPDAIPEAPVATDDVYGVMQDTMLSVKMPGLLFNDTDSEPGDVLEIASVDESGLAGTLAWAANGGFVYTPPAGFTGNDHFWYRAKDSHGYLSLPVEVELQVGDGSVNHAPVAVADHFVVKAGQTNLLSNPFALANDSDPDGDAISRGVFEQLGDGELNWYDGDWARYTPPAGFTGLDTFSYRLKDEHGKFGNEAKIVFEVVADDGVNAAPEPHDDYAAVETGQVLVGTAPGVLANDFDADGDALTVMEKESAPNHGTFEVDQDGGYRYTPEAGFVGSDHVDVAISDGLATVSARLWIEVYAPGAEPVVGAGDFYVATIDEVLEVPAPGVLANDLAPAAATKQVIGISTQPQHGTVSWAADGSFEYTPDAGYLGPDEFRYELSANGEFQYPMVRLQVVPAGDDGPGDGTGGPGDGTGEPGEGAGEPGDGQGGGSTGGTAGEPGRPTETGGPAEPAADSATTASSDAGRGSSLAETGSDAAGAAAVSAVAVLLGLLGMVGARRRRRALR